MRQYGRTEIKLLTKLKKNYEYRTFFMSVLSSVSALLFALFNFYLETLYKTGWNTGIGIYYCLLVLSKSIVVLSEKSWAAKQLDENQKQKKRERMLLRQSILLFAVDLSLVAPLALMIFQKRHIEYTEISAIAVAAYTCYKTVMASINFVKTRKSRNLSVKIIRQIHFKDALVSVLMLQYVLTLTFGNGLDGKMLRVCEITSGLMWLALITVSALSLLKALKYLKISKQN